MTDEQQVIEYGITDTALAELKERLSGIDAAENYALAKSSLKECQQLRKKLTEAHKAKKADALAFGRRLDAEKNRIMDAIEEVEGPIKESKLTVDNEAARIEEERVAAIMERIDGIRALGEDLGGRSVSNLQDRETSLNLLVLDSTYEEFLGQAEGMMMESRAKLRMAIEKAKAAAEEQERMDRQREEQEEEQRKLDKQREEQEAKAKELREEQDKINEANRMEQERIAEENRKEQKRLDDEREKLAQETADREREEQEKADAEEAERRAAELAPDKVKLVRLASDILNFPVPTCDSDEAIDAVESVRRIMIGVAKTLTELVEEMK